MKLWKNTLWLGKSAKVHLPYRRACKDKPAEHVSCRIHSIDRSVTSHLDHRQASWNFLPVTVPLTIKGVHPLEDPTKADKQNQLIYWLVIITQTAEPSMPYLLHKDLIFIVNTPAAIRTTAVVLQAARNLAPVQSTVSFPVANCVLLWKTEGGIAMIGSCHKLVSTSINLLQVPWSRTKTLTYDCSWSHMEKVCKILLQ